jgi:hypothetical protein
MTSTYQCRSGLHSVRRCLVGALQRKISEHVPHYASKRGLHVWCGAWSADLLHHGEDDHGTFAEWQVRCPADKDPKESADLDTS